MGYASGFFFPFSVGPVQFDISGSLQGCVSSIWTRSHTYKRYVGVKFGIKVSCIIIVKC